MILAAIAIPLFLNQKFKAAKAAVAADAKNANNALNLALAQIFSPVLADIEYSGGEVCV